MLKTIYAIPGLGTTGKLFEYMRIANCEVKILQWPQPESGMALEHYAQLFVQQIDTSKPFSLLGVSFGGMICSELSHVVNAEKVILISSCKNKMELPFIVRFQKYIPLYKWFSENLLRQFAFNSRWILGFEKEYKDVFSEMINSMPKNYISLSIGMIVNWANTKTPKNCIHIQGKKDHLLLYRNVKADHSIENGGHAMIVYQAKEINGLLSGLMG
ncbi:MAG: alpha/beta hydrolase [Bacteroidota bacterium]|nr:alpha/beta hydrolase [Bacteroidota bacterium]